MSLRISGALLTAVVLTGCQGHDERLDSSVQFVARYLEAASGGDELRGWSMIDRHIRSAMFEDRESTYLTAVKGADWTGFAWEVDNAWTDDDFVVVRVRLTSGKFPAFLLEPRADFTLASGDGDSRSFVVRFGVLGTRSLFAMGG